MHLTLSLPPTPVTASETITARTLSRKQRSASAPTNVNRKSKSKKQIKCADQRVYYTISGIIITRRR